MKLPNFPVGILSYITLLLYFYTFVTLVKLPNLTVVVFFQNTFDEPQFTIVVILYFLYYQTIHRFSVYYIFYHNPAPDYNSFSTFDIASQVSQANFCNFAPLFCIFIHIFYASML